MQWTSRFFAVVIVAPWNDKKGENAVSLLHVSDIPDLLVSCLLSFVSGYREILYLSLSSHCQRVMSLSVKPSTHEVLDIISPPS